MLSRLPALGLLCLSLFCVISCKKAEVYSSKNVNNARKNESLAPKGSYNPSRTLKHDLLHTKLEVSFDWEKQYVNGAAELLFTPYFYPQNVLEIDAKGFDIHEIVLDGKKKGYKPSFDYDNSVITILLDTTYSRTDTFSVKIRYTAKPEELPEGGSKAITSDKGLYFINPTGSDPLKPKQIWTQGETEANSKWFPTIDSPNERCTQEMFITADTSYTILSNGELMYSIDNGDGTHTAYWKMDVPHAPYLFMMAIGKYAVIKDAYEDIELTYYVEEEFAPYAKDIFGNTPEMIKFFSEKLNYPFPWPKYAQVVVRDYVSGAMENTSATIFMEDLQCTDRDLLDESWDGIIAHELFHQWFGNLVTCESWSNLPLNEAFANYSEYLWAEYKNGKDEADYLGKNELEEYLDEANSKQEPLIRFHYHDREDMFDRHSYNKGGRVLHMLRSYVGDDAFFKSLNLYLTRHQFSPVEVHHLRLAFEDVTGEDLNWFFNQWFLAPGHASLQVKHSYLNNHLVLKINQKGDNKNTPVYKLPLDLDIWENGEKMRKRIWIDSLTHEFKIPVSKSPDLVVIDPEFILLGKLQHEKSKDEWLYQYYNYTTYLARDNALANLWPEGKNTDEKLFYDKKMKKLLGDALADPFWDIRLTALSQFSNYLIPDIDVYIKTIEKLALSDPDPKVKSRSINLVRSYSPLEYLHVYKKGLEDKPYSVVAASLYASLMHNPSGVNVEDFEQMDNFYVVMNLGEYYVAQKRSSKYAWFKEKLIGSRNRYQYPLVSLFGNYVMMLGSAEEKADAKKVLLQIAKSNPFDEIKNLAKTYANKL
ncbi:MAG: M1 family metallopeptidase [Cytophagaceae bacterium]